jgi:GNAT superfamily N-acetyltransferase
MKISIRKANLSDMDFIVEGIIRAEMSGSTVLPYTSLFDLNEDETKSLIHTVMDEEIEGQEWYLPNFTILEVDGINATCLSSWIEGETNIGSGVLKAQAMAWYLQDKWTQASQKLDWLKTMQLPRIERALQLECIYTQKQYRGMGLAALLIEYCIAEAVSAVNPPKTAEIQLLGNNESALRSYTKCGFLLREEVSSPHPEILNLLADQTRISLTKTL